MRDRLRHNSRGTPRGRHARRRPDTELRTDLDQLAVVAERGGQEMPRNWLLGLVTLVVLSSCTPDTTDVDPSPTGTTAATTTRLTPSAIATPLGLGDRWKKPCELIEVFSLEDYGFGDEEDGEPFETAQGAACRWTATDARVHMAVRLEIIAYPNYDIIGQTYADADKALIFKPTSLTLDGLPAAYVVDDPASCAFVAGLSATQGVKVTYSRAQPFGDMPVKDRCSYPYSAVSGVVSTIRPPK
ncbi:DUF3558 family protein [Actinokineospora sp. HUAS TT18]|uniref:DUF3558 family protein n=1 Tax=Actinokineospora sp. HUAS TT18 TaxID=3447451 RepID=UPI003F5225C8